MAFIPNLAAPPQVDMIRRPALRLATRPFPPGFFAARFLAAVILPPLLFLAIVNTSSCFGPSESEAENLQYSHRWPASR